MMDNRQFNVNGKGDEMLAAALALAFKQCGSSAVTCNGWLKSPKSGLVLFSWAGDRKEVQSLPSSLSAAQVMPIVIAYLDSKEATAVKLEHWDANADHDGSNGIGWRVYVDAWGHVEGMYGVICAIKRTYLWYGK
jgi:hypothetical protein